jgi:hypothetical protein
MMQQLKCKQRHEQPLDNKYNKHKIEMPKNILSINGKYLVMTDLMYLGVTIAFFVICFGIIKFFDSLSRSDL